MSLSCTVPLWSCRKLALVSLPTAKQKIDTWAKVCLNFSLTEVTCRESVRDLYQVQSVIILM